MRPEISPAEPADPLVAVLRFCAPWLASLTALHLVSIAAVPLSLVLLDSEVPWSLPLAAGLLSGWLESSASRALRLRLRPRLFSHATALALDRARAASETLSETFVWSAHLAERAIAHALPLAIAACIATVLTAALAMRQLGVAATAGVLFLVALALVARVVGRRTLRGAQARERDARERATAVVAAAARDDGELARGAPRAQLLARVTSAAAGWVDAETRLDLASRRLRHVVLGVTGVALVLGLSWSTGLSLGWLASPLAEATTRSLRDLLVLASVAPMVLLAARAFDEMAGALELSRALGDLSLTRPRATRSLGPLDASARIDADGLTVRYGEHVALESVSFTLPLLGVAAIVGPNGAGKSTLARALVGLVTPSAGHVRVAGIDTIAITPDELALVPQQPVLIESLGVADNVRLLVPDASDDAIARALARVGSTADLTHLVGASSRGEQRRVAVARAMLRTPQLLVLDEPDAWLDRAGREAMASALREEGTRRTIVLVTHRADLVRWVDRVVVLTAAHTVEAVGSPEELLERSPTFATLLGDAADEALRLGAELGPRR